MDIFRNHFFKSSSQPLIKFKSVVVVYVCFFFFLLCVDSSGRAICNPIMYLGQYLGSIYMGGKEALFCFAGTANLGFARPVKLTKLYPIKRCHNYKQSAWLVVC